MVFYQGKRDSRRHYFLFVRLLEKWRNKPHTTWGLPRQLTGCKYVLFQCETKTEDALKVCVHSPNSAVCLRKRRLRMRKQLTGAAVITTIPMRMGTRTDSRTCRLPYVAVGPPAAWGDKSLVKPARTASTCRSGTSHMSSCSWESSLARWRWRGYTLSTFGSNTADTFDLMWLNRVAGGRCTRAVGTVRWPFASWRLTETTRITWSSSRRRWWTTGRPGTRMWSCSWAPAWLRPTSPSSPGAAAWLIRLEIK